MAEFPEGLEQPDQKSCGAACLVVAQGLRDAAYRERVADPATFRVEVLAMHGRVTSTVDVAGRIQPPWPRDLGTPPWAVANQLSGTTHVDHRSVPMRWRDGDDCYAQLVDLPSPAALYVGSAFLPRHVVLVLEGNSTRLRVYEPARGDVATVARDAFVEHRLRLAGWDSRWFAVVPER
ncbi:hypothetical protein [Nocardioides sp. GXQ0305]|uniref:hypothetical protein n=1 Tax=Nocardioides sp. GXQ0305 TaxID=3423912 RepID=UPI003D7D22FB